jgi:S-adenosylmethionine hydrolase
MEDMTCPIITLTTDFGLKDPYVSEMKAVILGISPNAIIVDITHEVEKFNTKMAAYVLASASPYFPKGTIHVAVIDPSVGTKRKAILVHAEKSYFVGPDNGVLTLATKNQNIKHVYEITNQKLMLPEISGTFHGRDIFAPAAAYLANGTLPAAFGPEIHRISTLTFATLVNRKNTLIGEVIHIDDFGNIVTNFGQRELGSMGIKGSVNIKVGSTKLRHKLCTTYSKMKPQELLAVIGSHGLLEISINHGNAAKTLKIEGGDKAILYRTRS